MGDIGQPSDGPNTCPTCGGDGKCHTCWGTGKDIDGQRCPKVCGTCGGSGKKI